MTFGTRLMSTPPPSPLSIFVPFHSTGKSLSGCFRSSIYLSSPIKAATGNLYIFILIHETIKVRILCPQVLRDLQAFWLWSLHEHLLRHGHDSCRLALPNFHFLRPNISWLVLHGQTFRGEKTEVFIQLCSEQKKENIYCFFFCFWEKEKSWKHN